MNPVIRTVAIEPDAREFRSTSEDRYDSNWPIAIEVVGAAMPYVDVLSLRSVRRIREKTL